ncbi:MAG: quinolinate synthase NadA [Candidatus Bathyarchaeota archaeon]|nr:quinolinate synthase NadA [Candidatus Bathyarchaeota archaeon]
MSPPGTEELQRRILELKEEKGALLLAHNYQVGEIQEVADFVGDSLELCRRAQEVEEADLIVFCGVDFMAETASILNPDKRVVIPNLAARCPMAAMLPMSVLREAKENNPEAAVVVYVNTLAEAKAESDVTCTSANAAEIITQLEEETVLFGPDRNLVWYVSSRVPDKTIIPVPDYGHCNVHRFFGEGTEAMELKRKYPKAELLVHPECEPEFQLKADHVLSTGGIYRRCVESDAKVFIIGTEVGMVDRLRREIPGKTFLPAKEHAECSAMKRIDLENTLEALRLEEPVVEVPDDIARRARIPIERMLAMSR